MKKLRTKGFYILSGIILFLCTSVSAIAQYTGVNLESGGLYTALAKDASNNLYLTRVTAGTSGATYEVDKYTGGTGTPVAIYSGLTHEVGDYPWGLAVDGSGNVYLTTDFTSGGGAIIKLTNSGGTYTPSTFQTGRYFSALALDATGNLYTAEYDAAHTSYAVVMYAAGSAAGAAGTTLYDNLTTAPGYTYPTGLSIANNGDVYVADAFSNTPSVTDGGHVYKLTKAFSYAVSTVTTGMYCSSLTVTNTGDLYCSENDGTGYRLDEYVGAAGSPVHVFSPLHTNGIYYPWGILFFSAGKIYVNDGDDGTNGGALIHLSLTKPTATTNPSTSVAATSATLNGTVNDNGNTTAVSFVYGTSSTLAGATTVPATTGGSIPAGSGNTAVAVTPMGLSGSTKYYYKVSATNSGGTVNGAILSFTTPPTLTYNTPNTFIAANAISPLTPTGSIVATHNYAPPVGIGTGLGSPFGVAASANGNVYVADYGHASIDKIVVATGVTTIVASGIGAPGGVAVDASGNVYFSTISGGTVMELVGGGGSPVTLASGLGSPYGVAVDAGGYIYVAAYSGGGVFKIPPGGGTPVAFGSGFTNPVGVAVDAYGNVFVADYGASTVTKFPAGGGASSIVGSGFANPTGVAVDGGGNVYVADYLNNLVKIIRPGNNTPASIGSGFNLPAAVSVDPFGNVFVADYNNVAVKEIKPVGGYFINPALPAGLSFSGNTGVISGTPTAESPATDYTVTAYDAGGGTSAIVNIAVTPSPNLASLLLSSGALTPAFSGTTTSYTASVGFGVTSITETPTAVDATATITVNGTAVSSGTASGAIPLNIGPNTVTTIVTAHDGVTTKTYTVTVTRAQSNNANLSSLAISAGSLYPVFATGTTGYTASVDNTVTSITVTPKSSNASATITVNGVSINSGTASGAIPLNVGPNTITTIVTAPDGVTTKTYTITVTRAPSSNADLSNLALSAGTLSRVFDAATTSYTASVISTISSVTLTPTTGDAGATVTVNGIAVSSGSASGGIPLVVGSNTITTVVTAQDGETTKTYTVTVTRLSGNANLSGLAISAGTLTPAFATATTSYTASVANTVSTITVTPKSSNNAATITVNGAAVSSGAASGAIPLNAGPNTITTIVTAPDGVTTKTYTVTVTRAASSNANLSGLALSTGTLSPVFATATTSYTALVGNGITSVTETATASDATATITVNGVMVSSGTPSGAIPLNVGTNAITTVVTAQDGVTTKTYTVTVTRQLPGNPNLLGLTISAGTLTPAFATATTSYTASVANTVTSLTETPKSSDPLATITVNGTPVTSGTASGAIPLSVGDNVVSTIVTAENGTTTKTYTITVTRASGGANSVYEPVSVTNPAERSQMIGEEVAVHQGLSPNGDGVNDFLMIDGITNYPDNKLTIMNRSGQLVFEAKGYDNSTRVFDGHSSKTGVMQLPGTYFYLLDYTANGATKHKTGFIVLKY